MGFSYDGTYFVAVANLISGRNTVFTYNIITNKIITSDP
jgi:hypothetical protein